MTRRIVRPTNDRAAKSAHYAYLKCFVCGRRVIGDAVTDTTRGLAHRPCVQPVVDRGVDN